MNKPAICGSVTYIVTLISGPSSSLVPTVDPGIPSVTAESTQSNQIGSYQFNLRSQSTFYPQLYIDRDLFVTVDECIVTLFEFSEALADIEYVLGSPTQSRRIEPFLIEPACDFEVEYQVNLVNTVNQLVPLPNGFDFFEESNGDLTFTVQTSAENDIGEYVIQVTGSIDEGPQAGTQSNFRFTVLV